MKVFSKQKFIESEGYDVYLKCKDWVDECDGKLVVNNEIQDNGYNSHKDWEKEID